MEWYADLVASDDSPPAKSPRATNTSPRDARATRAASMLSKLHVQPADDAPEQAAHPADTPPDAPLVVIVQRAEAVDMATLHTLLSLFHRSLHRLPVCLILGMGTSPTCFLRDLPVGCASLLQPTHCALHKASRAYEQVIARVVLGQHWPGLLFASTALDVIHRQFVYHDFSAAAVCKGLHVACMQHFMSQPSSVLAGALFTGGPAAAQAVFDGLPAAAKRRVLQSLGGGRVEAHCRDLLRAWVGWTVVLHWLAEAGATATAHLGTETYLHAVCCFRSVSL